MSSAHSASRGGGTIKEIVEHYEACLAEHGDSHLGVDWPNADDARRRYDVMLELIRDRKYMSSLLDLGCGAAHLLDHIRENGIDFVDYSGADLSPRFVELCQSKYPERSFYQIDIIRKANELPDFDYVIMNGVFTEKLSWHHDDFFSYMKHIIRSVYEKTRQGMAFNVMSKNVDWERDDLFHLSLDDLTEYLTREVSRHFVIRSDYGLYEYTAYVYRNPS